MDTNTILTFLIAGGILLIAFLKLSNPLKVNRKGNIYFGVFLLLWSTFYIDEAFVSQEFTDNSYFFITKNLIQFFTPLFFYTSIKFYTNPNYKLKKRDIRFLILPVVYFLFLYYKSFTTKSVLELVLLILIFSHALFYIVLAYLTINKHQKDIESFISNKEPIDLNWIKNIIYLCLASTVITVIYSANFSAAPLNLYINLYFLVVVYVIAYFSIKQKEIYPPHLDVNEIIDNEDENIVQTSRLLFNDTELKLQKEKLLQLMHSEKPYLDSELTLVKLAEKMDLSTHQLSFVINNGFGENFFNFVNRYKVNKAKELLRNPEYDHYTILAIGFESGFNSKTAFNTTFKKITSHTPTEYRKIRSAL